MKEKWPRREALEVASALLEQLEPACVRVAIAGSLRRAKAEVGDVEILYVPRMGTLPRGADLFPDERRPANLADAVIARMESERVLERRLNAKGHATFGALNKLMRHVASGVPVDLFSTTEECWYNYLVCRTGGAENNISICRAAQARGLKWTPYGAGFLENGVLKPVRSEREVFEMVGLPYLEPEKRP